MLSAFNASAVTPQSSSSTTNFSDNFSTTGNASQLSTYWTSQAGDFQVNTTNDTATGIGSTGTLDLATVNGISSANEAVSATVTVTSGEYAGLVARYAGTGDENMYYGAIVAGSGSYTACIFRNVNGVWTSLVSQTYSGTVTGAALQFDVVGTSLKLYLNNVSWRLRTTRS